MSMRTHDEVDGGDARPRAVDPDPVADGPGGPPFATLAVRPGPEGGRLLTLTATTIKVPGLGRAFEVGCPEELGLTSPYVFYADLRRLVPASRAARLTPVGAGSWRPTIESVAYRRLDVEVQPPGAAYQVPASLWSPRVPREARPLVRGSRGGDWLPSPPIFEVLMRGLCDRLGREPPAGASSGSPPGLGRGAVWLAPGRLLLMDDGAFSPAEPPAMPGPCGPPSDPTGHLVELARAYVCAWARSQGLADETDLGQPPGCWDGLDDLPRFRDALERGLLRLDMHAVRMRARVRGLGIRLAQASNQPPYELSPWPLTGRRLKADEALRDTREFLHRLRPGGPRTAPGTADEALDRIEQDAPADRRLIYEAGRRLADLWHRLDLASRRLESLKTSLAAARARSQGLHEALLVERARTEALDGRMNDLSAALDRAHRERDKAEAQAVRHEQAARVSAVKAHRLRVRSDALEGRLAEAESAADQLARECDVLAHAVCREFDASPGRRAVALLVDLGIAVALARSGVVVRLPDLADAGPGSYGFRGGMIALLILAFGLRSFASPGRALAGLIPIRLGSWPEGGVRSPDFAARLTSAALHYGPLAAAVWALGALHAAPPLLPPQEAGWVGTVARLPEEVIRSALKGGEWPGVIVAAAAVWWALLLLSLPLSAVAGRPGRGGRWITAAEWISGIGCCRAAVARLFPSGPPDSVRGVAAPGQHPTEQGHA